MITQSIPPKTILKGDGGDELSSKEYHLPSTSARAFKVEYKIVIVVKTTLLEKNFILCNLNTDTKIAKNNYFFN